MSVDSFAGNEPTNPIHPHHFTAALSCEMNESFPTVIQYGSFEWIVCEWDTTIFLARVGSFLPHVTLFFLLSPSKATATNDFACWLTYGVTSAWPFSLGESVWFKSDSVVSPTCFFTTRDHYFRNVALNVPCNMNGSIHCLNLPPIYRSTHRCVWFDPEADEDGWVAETFLSSCFSFVFSHGITLTFGIFM